jgi:hypothetical protein
MAVNLFHPRRLLERESKYLKSLEKRYKVNLETISEIKNLIEILTNNFRLTGNINNELRLLEEIKSLEEICEKRILEVLMKKIQN